MHTDTNICVYVCVYIYISVCGSVLRFLVMVFFFFGGGGEWREGGEMGCQDVLGISCFEQPSASTQQQPEGAPSALGFRV